MDSTMDLGPQTIHSFADLRAMFEHRGLPHVFDPETQVIETPVSRPPLETMLYLRWEKSPILQLIATLITDLPLKRLHELEVACCRLNSAVPLPGFGIDYTRRALYYRFALRTVDPISATMLDRMIMSLVINARDFLPAFQAIVAGQAGAEVVTIALATKPAPPPASP